MTHRATRTQVLMDKIKVAFEGRKETLSHLKVCRHLCTLSLVSTPAQAI